MASRKKSIAPSADGNFEALVGSIVQIHQQAQDFATKAVNIGLTLRNWFIGHRIVEFEQQGCDRAAYGERLLPVLAERLAAAGLKRVDTRELRRFRLLYTLYPQIRETVTPELLARSGASALQPFLHFAWPAKRETLSPESPRSQPDLLQQLSFSHLSELLELPDETQRRFYEIECIRGNWSVRELRRQIASLYYERSGLSKDKAKLSAMAQAKADSDAYQGLLRDLKAAVGPLQTLHEEAVAAISPIVGDILQNRSRDTRLIEHTLDHLLDHACIPQGLACFRSLCRYYWQINSEATASYVYAHREMWGAEADNDQEADHV